MARTIDSDYIDFSRMGGFDLGINFDEFEENVKKFMELPIKYLDSAHDKAIEFIEDVHAIFYAPFTDDEVTNKDQSSHYVITESSPTSIEKELVGPNAEPSTPPASLITMENSSTVCEDTDAHQTESFSTKSTGLSLMNHVYPENNSSDIESNDLCIVPEDISTARIYDSSDEVILWNPETSLKPWRSYELTTIPQDDHAPHALEEEVIEQVGLNCSGHSDSSVCSGVIPLENYRANYEEQMALHSANDPVGVTVHDPTSISQDDYISHTLHMEQMAEQAGLHCSGHSDILVNSTDFINAPLLEDSSTINHERAICLQPCQASLPGTQANRPEVHMVSYSAKSLVESTIHGTCTPHVSSTSVSSCAADPSMWTDNMVNYVDMKNDKIEVYPVPQRENASFKKMFLRNLSRKLRWSKRQAMTPRSQDTKSLGYQVVSSSDDLEDGWEVL